MGLFDEPITQIYECSSCGVSFSTERFLSQDILVSCPNCNKNTLKWIRNVIGLSVSIDTKIPKTLGTLAEKNSREKEKRGESIDDRPDAKDVPWWRREGDKGRRPNLKILKNPIKYIETGEI
ncbi:MAG: hypothetical protein WC967_12060 [Balneolaceae bacterium]